jgi:hypothetical protein
MRSFDPRRLLGLVALIAACTYAAAARAQQAAAGFAVERFYPSAPGGGWFVMDTLDMQGGLGGALALTLGTAGGPLRVADGAQSLTVVSNDAFLDVGAAVTYRRLRVYLNFPTPIAITGDSGTAQGYSFTGPSLTLGSNPDTLAGARIGADVRILGSPVGRFRLGAGAQLLAPGGARSDYDDDATFRGMLRVLAAGDVPYFTWAAQLGVQIRPLDDMPTPQSPRGNELLFGAAAGAKLPVRSLRMAAVVGAEVWGATAFHGFFGENTTAVEGLLSGRFEGTQPDRVQLRAKLGVGGGLNPQFGAPEWRLVGAVEMFGWAR